MPFIPKAVAVTVTVEAAVPVSVTVAIPQVAPGHAPVVAVAVEEPEKLADVLLKVKFTVAPPTSAFVPSLTVAVIVDVLLTVIDDGFAATLTLPPPPPPVIVTWALPFTLPIAAVTVTMVFTVPAVKVTVATPQVGPGHAPVVADAALRLAYKGLLRLKLTVAPPMGLPILSTT